MLLHPPVLTAEAPPERPIPQLVERAPADISVKEALAEAQAAFEKAALKARGMKLHTGEINGLYPDSHDAQTNYDRSVEDARNAIFGKGGRVEMIQSNSADAAIGKLAAHSQFASDQGSHLTRLLVDVHTHAFLEALNDPQHKAKTAPAL